MTTDISAELISVIIPVYNMEAYLAQCVDSVLAQTHPTIEIVLIDDGSTDNSLAICQAYEKKHSHVRLHSQVNGGVSAALNKGIDLATGQWIALLGADDWVASDMYAKLLQAARTQDVQLAACGFTRFFETGEQENRVANLPAKMSCEQAIAEVIRGTLSGSQANKLFSRQVIGDIRHNDSLAVGEDGVFVVEVIVRQRLAVAYVPEGLYYYRLRVGSATKSFNPKSLTALDALEITQKRVSEVSKKLQQLAGSHMLFLGAILCIKAVHGGQPQYVKQIRKRIKPHLGTLFVPGTLRLPKKIASVGMLLFPRTCAMLRSALSK